MANLVQMIEAAGGPTAFSRLSGIPYRTLQSWRKPAGRPGARRPPEWLPDLLADALTHRRRRALARRRPTRAAGGRRHG